MTFVKTTKSSVKRRRKTSKQLELQFLPHADEWPEPSHHMVVNEQTGDIEFVVNPYYRSRRDED